MVIYEELSYCAERLTGKTLETKKHKVQNCTRHFIHTLTYS